MVLETTLHLSSNTNRSLASRGRPVSPHLAQVEGHPQPYLGSPCWKVYSTHLGLLLLKKGMVLLGADHAWSCNGIVGHFCG